MYRIFMQNKQRLSQPEMRAGLMRNPYLCLSGMAVILFSAGIAYYNVAFQILLAVLMVVVSLSYPPGAVVCAVLGYIAPLRIVGVPPISAIYGLILGLMAINTLLHWQRGELRVSFGMLICMALYGLSMSRPCAGEHGTWEFVFSRAIGFAFGLLTAIQIKTRDDRNLLALTILIFSTLLSVTCLLNLDPASRATTADFLGYWDRNYASCLIGMGIFPALAWLICDFRIKSLPVKFIALGLILVNLLAILKLASRGMSLSMAAAIILVLAFRFKKFWQLAGISLVLFLIIPSLLSLPFFEPLKNRFEERGAGSFEKLGGRLGLFEDALDHIGKSNPLFWVFGEGTGATFDDLQASSHNMYISLFIDYGLVGFLSMGAIAFTILWRAFFREKGWWRYSLFGSMVFVLMCGMSIEPYVDYYLWITIALMLPSDRNSIAADNLKSNRNNKPLKPLPKTAAAGKLRPKASDGIER